VMQTLSFCLCPSLSLLAIPSLSPLIR
jgi:hypothetical protein